MAAFVSSPRSQSALPLAFRFALRELRGGIRGFVVFLACIALGVMAISGVGAVARAMLDTLAHEGRAILGGDISFSLLQREASPAEAAWLTSLGKVSRIATLRAMARDPRRDTQSLVELKAVDRAYPLVGDILLEGGGDLASALAPRDGVPGAVAEPALLVRLGAEPGATISVGDRHVRLAGTIAREPDKVGIGIGFGPRLLVSHAALEGSGLLEPGSLVRWTYRVALAGAADSARLKAIADEAAKLFPQAGWEIRSRANAAPGLAANVRRFAEFLTLVGLTALIVGGVGVANAVRAHLDGKREAIAIQKSLGAPGRLVVAVYLAQIMVLASLGVLIGLILGALVPPVVAAVLGDTLPLGERATVYPAETAIGAAFGLLTALAFALLPLGRAHDVPPSALFRDRVAPDPHGPRRAYLAASGATLGMLALLALATAQDRRLALIVIGGAAASFLLLWALAKAISHVARAAPRPRSTALRLALANLHRPGNPTASVVLSLGLGLTLIVALSLVEASLRHQLSAQLPANAPSFFFLDVPNRQVDAFSAHLREIAPGGTVEHVPMMRGRIVALNGAPPDPETLPPDMRWVLNGDRGITYAARPPENATIVEGRWWDETHAGPPLVSFDAELARGLGLKVGDKLTVNVLGREVEAAIANLRAVKWETLGINFVMIFSPDTFRGAPHARLATLALPDGAGAARELEVLRSVTTTFPNVTAIRVKDALARVNEIVGELGAAVRAAASVTLLTSILVLSGALAAGQRRRTYDAVVLKTLGATRRRLIGQFALEFGLLGLAAAVVGVILGTIAAWAVLEQVMRIDLAWRLDIAILTGLIATAITVALGLGSTWRSLGRKPGPVLRDL